MINNDQNIHKPSYGGFTSQPQLFPFHLAQSHPWDPDIVGQQGRVLRQHMDQAAETHLALVNHGGFHGKWLRYPLVNIQKALENHYFIAG